MESVVQIQRRVFDFFAMNTDTLPRRTSYYIEYDDFGPLPPTWEFSCIVCTVISLKYIVWFEPLSVCFSRACARWSSRPHTAVSDKPWSPHNFTSNFKPADEFYIYVSSHYVTVSTFCQLSIWNRTGGEPDVALKGPRCICYFRRSSDTAL